MQLKYEERPGGDVPLRAPREECLRRCVTLPHPLKCSTITVPGLSYRVRKGTGRDPWAMTTAKTKAWWRSGNRTMDASNISLPFVCEARVCAPCRSRMRCPATHAHPKRVCRVGVPPLVPVSSTARTASTPGLSTTSSTWGVTTLSCQGILILEKASRLDAFSGYPFRT